MNRKINARGWANSILSPLEICQPACKAQDDCRRQGGKIVRVRGTECLLQDCVSLKCSYTHKVLPTFLPKCDLNNNNKKNCNKHVKVHGRRIMSLKPKKEQARKLIFNAFTDFHRWFKDLLVAWQGVNATLLHVSIIVLFVWLKVSKGPICQGLYLANRRGEE